MQIKAEKLLIRKDFVGQVARKTRRFYYSVFKKDYVRKSIAENREGECNRCGACCQMTLKCPFLGKDVHQLPYCRIYGDLRPFNCHSYPFDKLDSEIEICSFRFKE